MNIVILLTSMVASLGLGSLHQLLMRYFPYLPTEFDSTTTPRDQYDFVVVGAGCGGSVVASRLSETSASVLLLEAGGSAQPETASPLLTMLNFFRYTEWNYEIKPQNNAYLGFVKNTPMMRLGKVMGGSSTINGMVYTRGHKMDYDSWARLGNTGWDYDSVLPYFKKSENYHPSAYPVKAKYHGRHGPVNVSMTDPPTILLHQFLEAGQQLGYNTVDPNSPENLGFFPPQRTNSKGVRSSASESFLAPVVDRPNLQIRTNALVTKVLFNNRRRAVGVEYVIDGKRRRVLARKEVILSAGAVRSPQLLLLSGVGPREHLQEMGIPVVADVPGVGRNLHEHPGYFLPLSIKEGAYNPTGSFTKESFRAYIKNATGPLGRNEGQGWALVKAGEDPHPTWPDVLLSLLPDSFAVLGPHLTADMFGYRPEIFEDIYGSLEGTNSIHILLLLARPKSRGSVSLKTTSPADNPIIDINLFDHPDDLKLFIKGVRTCLDLANTPAFRDVLDIRLPDNPLSQCKHHSRETDAYWGCLLQHMAFAGFHLTSAAMMAPNSNPRGVVDPRLRVRGVTGLRVVDSSIMPHNVGANPMATTYMIGEKGSDMIREDWGYFTEFIS